MSEADILQSNRKMTRREKLLMWAMASGLASILGIYVYAGDTAEHTPIRVPAAAEALPWPNGNAQPFLVPATEVDEVNCGSVHTFLGSLYDGSMDDTKSVESVRAYESTYEAARGDHTDAATAAIRLAVASIPHARVAVCPPAPTVMRRG